MRNVKAALRWHQAAQIGFSEKQPLDSVDTGQCGQWKVWTLDSADSGHPPPLLPPGRRPRPPLMASFFACGAGIFTLSHLKPTVQSLQADTDQMYDV